MVSYCLSSKDSLKTFFPRGIFFFNFKQADIFIYSHKLENSPNSTWAAAILRSRQVFARYNTCASITISICMYVT